MPTLQANRPTTIYFPSNAATGPSPYTALPPTMVSTVGSTAAEFARLIY